MSNKNVRVAVPRRAGKTQELRDREHGAIDSDRSELIDLERLLALTEFSRSVDRHTAASARARVAAAFKALHDMLDVVDDQPLGVTHARIVDPLRKWRAARAIIASRIAAAREHEAAS